MEIIFLPSYPLAHVSMDNSVSPFIQFVRYYSPHPLTGRSRIYATKIRQGLWAIKSDFVSGFDLDVETADHNPPISNEANATRYDQLASTRHFPRSKTG